MKTPRVPEKVVQAQIVQLLRSLGAKVYVLGTTRPRGDSHHGTCQTPGIADLEVFLPRPRVCTDPRMETDRRLLKIEVKAPGGRMTPEQRDYAATCATADVAHLVGGLDDVIAWLIYEGYLARESVGHYHQPKAG